MSNDTNDQDKKRGKNRPWAPEWSSVDRRDFLLTLGLAGAGATAGCTGVDDTESTESATVVDVDGNPVADARVSLLITDVTLDGAADGLRGHYKDTTTDANGTFSFTPPSDEENDIKQLVLTAQKGNWFTVETYDIVDTDVPDDYGEFTLNHQILSGPIAVRTNEGAPFGVVTVWRYLFDDATQVFFVEVANTNEYDHQPEWEILRQETPGGGPASGFFLLGYPEERAINIANNDAFANADPTGSGDVEIFGTHGKREDGLMGKLFHPLRDYMELPMYTTTKRIGTGAPDSVEDPDGWSPITPETLKEAEEIEERVEEALEMVGRLPGGKKSIGVLLDLKDTLEAINRFLDREERVAWLSKTPETPIVGGGYADYVFDLWESDYPTLGDRWENAVVFQVPLHVETDDPFDVSVLVEWTRPFNDRGEFSGTFATGLLDVAMTYPTSPVEPGEEYVVNTLIRNQSLTTRQVAEMRFEFGDALAELDTVSLAPSKEIPPGDIWNPSEPRVKIPETDGRGTIDVTVIDEDAVTASRSRSLFVEGDEEEEPEEDEDEDSEEDDFEEGDEESDPEDDEDEGDPEDENAEEEDSEGDDEPEDGEESEDENEEDDTARSTLDVRVRLHNAPRDDPGDPPTVYVERDGEIIAGEDEEPPFLLEDGVEYTVYAEHEYGSAEQTVMLDGDTEITLHIGEEENEENEEEDESPELVIEEMEHVNEKEPNRERVIFRNAGDQPLDLTGWTAEGSAAEGGICRAEPYDFPEDTVLQSGDTYDMRPGHFWLRLAGEEIIIRNADTDIVLSESIRPSEELSHIGIVRVVDEDGTPVVGEPVTIESDTGTIEEETTDSNGKVILAQEGACDALYLKEVTVRDQTKELGIGIGTTTIEFIVEDEPEESETHVLTINVVTDEGDPLHALVRIEEVDENEAVIDHDGEFAPTWRFELEDGIYTVEAIDPGDVYLPAERTVEIDREDEEITIELEPKEEYPSSEPEAESDDEQEDEINQSN